MRTTTPRFIASERLLWRRADGIETTIVISIGEPYEYDAMSWACPAWLEGIEERHMDIIGISSLQALCLALRYVEQRLGHMLGSHGQLLYAADRSPFDARLLAALFGRPGA